MSATDASGINVARANPGPAIWDRGSGGELPSIFLFTANPTLEGLESALQARGLQALRVQNMANARRLLGTRRGSSIAVLDTFRPAPFSFDAIYNLLHDPPAVPTLVLVNTGDEHATPPPWEPGRSADDYAVLPASINELVMRVQTLMLRAGLPLPAGHAAPLGDSETRRRGQVIMLFGLKGGIGRSTIATNLAVGLVQFFGKEVALVDTDLWYSAQKHLLDLRSDKSMVAVAQDRIHLDQDVLRNILIPHSSGVQVVLGPQELTQVERISVDLPAQIVNAYRSMFDFIIVDTHPSMEEYVLQLLDVADQILLVTTPEVGPIRSTIGVLKVAPALGWRDKVHLILNRANAGVEVDRIEETLSMSVYATIVSAGPRVIDAANRGCPILMLDREGREEITRDLVRLVARIAGEPEPVWPHQRSPWRRALNLLPWTRPGLAKA